MTALSDTSPLNYLLLIQEVELLPRLFNNFIIPPAVHTELLHAEAPPMVRAWASSLPSWLTIVPPKLNLNLSVQGLGPGEREVIALAEEIAPSYVILDDQAARKEAMLRSLPLIGLLGVLRLARQRALIDLRPVFGKLQSTSFRINSALTEALLSEDF